MPLTAELKKIPARVRLGVIWLDVYRKNWRRQIQQKRLNMGTDTACILGQCDGSYQQRTDHNAASDVNRGFYTPMHDNEDDYSTYYKALTAAWRSELGTRTKRGKP